jgi:2'-5' RNA ligase
MGQYFLWFPSSIASSLSVGAHAIATKITLKKAPIIKQNQTSSGKVVECSHPEVAIKYLVALPIPEPAQSMVADIKANLKPAEWRDTMDPHITVLAPDRPLMPKGEAADSFLKACVGLQGFTVQTTQLRHFTRRNSRIIYLRLLPDLPIQNLFKIILDKTSWQDTLASEKRPYHPHITLVNQLPTNEAVEAEEELHALNIELSFTCTKVCLYAKQQSWPQWEALAESPLQLAK